MAGCVVAALFTGHAHAQALSLDGRDPVTARITFDPKDSGLTLDTTANAGFSRAAAKPTKMTECGEALNALLDPTIRHICFEPQGRMRAGTLPLDTNFVIKFRARIN